MIKKPFNKNLDSIIYKDSKYDPYRLNKTIEKINSGDWGEVSLQSKKDKEFHDKYLAELKYKNGYINNKPSSLSSFDSPIYSDKPIYVKAKDYWSKKSFLYKFFIFDIIVGAVSHLIIFLYMD